jgi:ferritin
MISEKLFLKLNSQINYEYHSANVYLAMAAFCESENLSGFANFFKVQVQEETFHASRFFTYINEMQGRVIIKGMPDPKNDFNSMLDIFKASLAHEKTVTSRIYDLMDAATEEKEHATISFLKWFIDEQVEEENTLVNIIKKLERIQNDANALYTLDTELAARVFIPPIIV